MEDLNDRYNETVAFLFRQLPMFQREGAKAFKKDLGNIIALCKALGDPQNSLKIVHIAGTNGKGSVTHLLKGLAMKSGLKTGAYTSPHYKDFRERIKINGSYIPKQDVIDFVILIRPLLAKIKPSFFEISVAMAFWYFKREEVDIAIIETGLGGRLDSTNIISPLLSIITNISKDHMGFLGDTLELIATEKAGIIKKNTPLVLGRNQAEILSIFSAKAALENVKIYQSESLVQVHNVQEGEYRITSDSEILPDRIITDVYGTFQQENIGTALASAIILEKMGVFSLSKLKVERAFLNISQDTNFMGRWQKIGDNPLIYVDSAHNEDGLSHVLKLIQSSTFERLHFVLGFVFDKDLSKVLKLLPQSAQYYFTQANIPRALDAHLLKKMGEDQKLKGVAFSNVGEAFETAKCNAGVNDLIFVGGSIFVVAEVL